MLRRVALLRRASGGGSPADVGAAIVDKYKHLISGGAPDMSPIATMHAMLSRSLSGVLLGNPQLFAFGSSVVFGLLEPASDVDFVILSSGEVKDGKGIDLNSEQAKGAQNRILARLASQLRKEHPSMKVEEIRRTRVPVIRVKEGAPHHHAFDITASRRNGVRNSVLLRRYFDQYPHARWAAMAIKSWSKRAGINNPSYGFLTSYAFNILIVYYLLHLKLVQHVPLDGCDVSTAPQIPSGLQLTAPSSNAELGELAQGFFKFYLNEFDYEKRVVTLSDRWESLTPADLKWTREAEDIKKAVEVKLSFRFCIEDPFEIDLNVGRNVTAFRLDILKKHFQKVLEMGPSFVG